MFISGASAFVKRDSLPSDSPSSSAGAGASSKSSGSIDEFDTVLGIIAALVTIIPAIFVLVEGWRRWWRRNTNQASETVEATERVSDVVEPLREAAGDLAEDIPLQVVHQS